MVLHFIFSTAVVLCWCIKRHQHLYLSLLSVKVTVSGYLLLSWLLVRALCSDFLRCWDTQSIMSSLNNFVSSLTTCFFFSIFFLSTKLAGTFRNSEKRNPCLMAVCEIASSLMPLKQWCYCKSYLYKCRNVPSVRNLQVSLINECWISKKVFLYLLL